MSATQRIAQTRQALVEALAERDWEAVGRLDLACRECIAMVTSEAPANEPDLRDNLEELLNVYRQLIDVATGERQAVVEEMSQLQKAKQASKVYDLFG
ncbi:flagellar protein FliT [Pseudomonas syringae]|nr:flagellar protein FliT [Pseudomonas syringae]MBD8574383.1 flagellar protein FliT [Pseudomonas syringae]MBD8788944.1 flagellar protein FliT [Pseudomonas syringae]MBD8800612.1 flagellar protein FliT [Pseudomonas syringae]MBD8812530.1 flagellar protein FliT [Pseudomonas syringae]